MAQYRMTRAAERLIVNRVSILLVLRGVLSPVILLMTGFVSSAVADDAPPAGGAKFNGIADLEDVVQIAKGVSEDGQAITVIFRNLEASVSGDKGPFSGTRSVTVALPIDKNNHDVNLGIDIRGFVNVQGKSRVLLVVQAAGKTTLVDLKEAQVKSPDASKSDAPTSAQQAKSRATEQAKGASKAKPDGAFDFAQHLRRTVPASAQFQVTFFLLAERDTNDAGSGADIVVDSLDVALTKPSSGKENK